MEDVQASMTTAPLPPPQMAPHESSKCHKLAALMEWRKAHLENDRLRRLQDGRHSTDDTEKNSEGSTMTTSVLALQDALCRSPKRRIPASKLRALKKRMQVYCEEEHLQKLQEEKES